MEITSCEIGTAGLVVHL